MDNSSIMTLSAVDRDTHVKLLSVYMESFDVSKEAIALMPSLAPLILNPALAADVSINRAFKMPEKCTVFKKIIDYCNKKCEKTRSSLAALKVWENEYRRMEQEALFEVINAAINFGMDDLKILLGKPSSAMKVMSEAYNNEITIVPKAVAALIPPWAKSIRDVFFLFCCSYKGECFTQGLRMVWVSRVYKNYCLRNCVVCFSLFVEQATMPFCDYCEYEQAGVSNDIGALYCSNCGKTIGEEHFSDEPTFNKGPGEDQIRMLISSLKIDDTIEHQANCFYGIAAHRGFTKKHKIDHVAAACLYVACRAKEKPYLLIDFSEKLAVSVYVLGAVFLQLCQLLLLDDHPIVQKPVDPSLFIHKFAEGLVAKLDEDTVPKKDVVNRISKTALHVIASMKRDWMQTGRKPSGLCGAAIYVAALMNRIRFTKSEVMTVVHTCEATLMKRLFEFGKTESGCLTIDEFNQRAEDFEREQPNGCTNGSDILCEHENEEVHAHGLCKECFDEVRNLFRFPTLQLSGGLNGGADPPSFQRPESEVAQDASRKINGPSTECISLEYTLGKEHHITSGQGNNIKMNETEKLAEPQFNYNYPVGNKESEDLTNDETEGLSDIKDAEVECYLNSKEEARYKKIIWEQVNKEYLEEQALKEAAKAASYSGMAEGTYEIQEAQKLARKVLIFFMSHLVYLLYNLKQLFHSCLTAKEATKSFRCEKCSSCSYCCRSYC
ncbi:hypothetical protein QQ045_011896 [Rhodiola kirilowii]